MKFLSKEIKLLLLFTFIVISTFSQNYELNKNVFFNNITNLYVNQGNPFNGILTINGVGYPSDRLGKIKKKVIQIKNGKVDGLLYSINEFGDTLNKFTIINGLVNGYFSFTFQLSGIYKITGYSNKDTLSGKINVVKFNLQNRKWENRFEGIYTKSGGHPIGEFKSYYEGRFVKKVKPFSDHIGLFSLNKESFIKFINDVNYNIGDLSMLKGFTNEKLNNDMVDEGVYYFSTSNSINKVNEYLYKNGNFIGFLKYTTGGRMVSGRYDNQFYKTFYYFNGNYEKGVNIDNYTKNQFLGLMELFKNNHTEYTYSIDKNILLHRKNYINGKLEGQFIDVNNGDDFKNEYLRTFFKDGVEIGPRTNRDNFYSYHIIEKVVNDKFEGKLIIFQKNNPYQPYITCHYDNGVIISPIIKYYNNGIKNFEIVKSIDEFIFNEYFPDGSLKFSKKLNSNELMDKTDEIMGEYKEIHQSDYSSYFRVIKKIPY
jgi:hypothetical protein